jgi:hypothetical protein
VLFKVSETKSTPLDGKPIGLDATIVGPPEHLCNNQRFCGDGVGVVVGVLVGVGVGVFVFVGVTVGVLVIVGVGLGVKHGPFAI